MMSHAVSLEGQPWWDALADEKLRVQRCRSCGTLRHYPSPMCGRCQSTEVDWHPLSGRGAVHSWTITHQTALTAFKGRVPYALVTVDLAEGVRMLAPLVATPFDELRVGLAVRLSFEPQADGSRLPTFSKERPDD
jgi:uncharacterized OB-fold protein